MNNRLAALRDGGGDDPTYDDSGDALADPGKGSQYAQPKFMETFFKDVESVKDDISQIRGATRDVSRINEQAKLATKPEKEQQLSAELDGLLVQTNQNAAHAKGVLKRLKDETQQLKDDPAAKKSEIRIRENLLITLTRKFVDMMKEYQNCQQKYKSDIKDKVQRQVRIVKPDASADEIDQVLSSGDTSSVYRSAILKGAADPIRNAYANVVDKYQDVLRLEQSVAELHQMFLDLALLVEQQGEMLDQIEYQIQSASDYIDDGNEEIAKALEHQRAARKRQCCILVMVLGVAGVCIGVFTSMSS